MKYISGITWKGNKNMTIDLYMVHIMLDEKRKTLKLLWNLHLAHFTRTFTIKRKTTKETRKVQIHHKKYYENQKKKNSHLKSINIFALIHKTYALTQP